jgi:hypothetical protein
MSPCTQNKQKKRGVLTNLTSLTDCTRQQKTYLSDGALDVSDNGAAGIVQELNANLDNVSGAAGSAEHLLHLGHLNSSGILKAQNTNGQTINSPNGRNAWSGRKLSEGCK